MKVYYAFQLDFLPLTDNHFVLATGSVPERWSCGCWCWQPRRRRRRTTTTRSFADSCQASVTCQSSGTSFGHRSILSTSLSLTLSCPGLTAVSRKVHVLFSLLACRFLYWLILLEVCSDVSSYLIAFFVIIIIKKNGEWLI